MPAVVVEDSDGRTPLTRPTLPGSPEPNRHQPSHAPDAILASSFRFRGRESYTGGGANRFAGGVEFLEEKLAAHGFAREKTGKIRHEPATRTPSKDLGFFLTLAPLFTKNLKKHAFFIQDTWYISHSNDIGERKPSSSPHAGRITLAGSRELRPRPGLSEPAGGQGGLGPATGGL